MDSRRWIFCCRSKKRKVFFFEKKKQKTFALRLTPPNSKQATYTTWQKFFGSFLKKEHFPRYAFRYPGHVGSWGKWRPVRRQPRRPPPRVAAHGKVFAVPRRRQSPNHYCE
jgi:hypothetical protein